VRLSRVLYRDAMRKTVASVRGYLHKSKNFIDDTEIEVQRRQTAGWEMAFTHREFIGAATIDANLAYWRGTGALNAIRAPEEAFGEGSSRPGIVTTDTVLSLPFTIGVQKLRYSSAWRAQWNRSALVPQDRFAIGGRYTVRGFDGENVLSADRGWLIRNDIGAALGQSGQELYLGIDYGRVSGPAVQYLLGNRLAGSVVGLRGAYDRFSYELFIGRPVIKPAGFQTAGTTGGFQLNWSY
jgi:hemolysin activation/secretion protein